MARPRYTELRRMVDDPGRLRLAMVRTALAQGVKPAARAFGTTPQTVRRWLRRYKRDGLSGLASRSRRPKRRHPRATPPRVEARVVAMRREHPEYGQDRIARLLAAEGVAISGKTVRKLLRRHGLIATRSRDATKRPPRRAANLAPFEEVQIDLLDLESLPPYRGLIGDGLLPRYEFALRDVATGATFLAFGRELTAANVVCFARRILRHLDAHGFRPRVIHTLEQSAWIRRRLDRELVDFLYLNDIVPNLLRNDEIADAWSILALHDVTRAELYVSDTPAGLDALLERAGAFSERFNLERYDRRRHGSPLQFARRRFPDFDPNALVFPPLCLDGCVC